jgi:uncharacterized protein
MGALGRAALNIQPGASLAPLDSGQRIGELDVLRGFALLGVFIVHFVGSGFYELPLDEAQKEAFRQDWLNAAALFVTELFFYNKANTLFATLFGMGFWVMMERLQERDVHFGRIYLRRLFVLFLIGLVNIFLIFPGDVLHEYAALGFVLFLLHKMPHRFFLFAGLTLAIGAYFISEYLTPGADAAGDRFRLVQESTFEHGGYWNWVSKTTEAHLYREFVGGALLGWALYIFGRFLLGAWVIQQGWIQGAKDNIPTIRRLALIAVPLGFTLEGASMLIYKEVVEGPSWLENILHSTGVVIQAAGYALLLILLFHSRFRGLATVFAPVGRMALSAYVLHGAIYTLIYFPFGLGLLGAISPSMAFGIAVALYATMTIACHWWLSRYKFGPLEYLWRWATYGTQPPFIRVRAVPRTS